MKILSINTYLFSELSEEAKSTAIANALHDQRFTYSDSEYLDYKNSLMEFERFFEESDAEDFNTPDSIKERLLLNMRLAISEYDKRYKCETPRPITAEEGTKFIIESFCHLTGVYTDSYFMGPVRLALTDAEDFETYADVYDDCLTAAALDYEKACEYFNTEEHIQENFESQPLAYWFTDTGEDITVLVDTYGYK